MPKLDLRDVAEQKDLTLADVPEGEWWLEDDGTPYQRENDEECVFYDQRDKIFRCSGLKPSQVKVIRKLCGPIELLWD